MITLALVDDNNLFRNALKAFIKQLKTVTVLFDAYNGEDLLTQLQIQKKVPDIILMDFKMPVLDGRQTTKLIKKQYPSVKVIMLSVFHHDYLISSMIGVGAKGYLSKNIEPEILEKAFYTIMDNQYFIETDNGNYEVFNFISKEKKNKFFSDHLAITDKQKFFIQLCCTALTYNEIALQMGISIKTVDNYREMLFKRFNVNNRVGLAMFAVQNGLTNILE